MRWGFEDVVHDAPDAVGLAALGVGEDLGEEEEGGVVLLQGAGEPGPGKELGEGFEADGVFELLGAGGEDDLAEAVYRV